MTCLQKHRYEKTHRRFQRWVGLRGRGRSVCIVFVEVVHTFTLQGTDNLLVVPSGCHLPIPMVPFLVQDPDIDVGCGVYEGLLNHEGNTLASECSLVGDVLFHNGDKIIRVAGEVNSFFQIFFRLRRLVDSFNLLNSICR